MLYKYIQVIIFSALLLSIVACGRGNRDADENRQVEADYRMHTTGLPMGAPVQSLSISAHSNIYQPLRAAGHAMRDSMAQLGIDFRLNINLIPTDDLEDFIILQQTQMYAGMGDDIVMFTHMHNILGLIEYGFLLDINPLLHTYSNRDDYITQVLDALEINGKLYMLPLSVPVQYVGINADLPPSVLAKFAQYDVISMNEMAQIYNYLQANYPAWGHLAFGLGAMPMLYWYLVMSYVDYYICWDTRTAYFPQGAHPPLDYFLGETLQAFINHNRYDTFNEITQWDLFDKNFMQLLSQRYVFSFCYNRLGSVYALMEFDAPIFTYHVPLVNQCGGLVTD